MFFLFSKDYFVLFSVQNTHSNWCNQQIFQGVAFSSIRFSISIVHKCFISWRNTWNISYSFFYLPLRKRRNIIDNNLSRDDPGQFHCCTVKHGEPHGWIVRSVRERCLKVSLSATIIGMSPSVCPVCLWILTHTHTKRTMVFWLCGGGTAAAASVCNQSVSIFFFFSFLRRSNKKMRNLLLLLCVAALTRAFHSLTDENLLSKSVGRSVGRPRNCEMLLD